MDGGNLAPPVNLLLEAALLETVDGGNLAPLLRAHNILSPRPPFNIAAKSRLS